MARSYRMWAMVARRICEWALREPDRTAVIYNDDRISYAGFAQAILSARRAFEAENLPPRRVALVFGLDLMASWIAILALRTLGVDTICVRYAAAVQSLEVRNLGCIVMSRSAIAEDRHRVFGKRRVVAMPDRTPNASESACGLDPKQFIDRPLGSHILCTSGTTGTFKKVLAPGSLEDARNQRTVRMQNFDQNIVYHGLDTPPWTSAGFTTPSAVWTVGGTMIFDDREDQLKRMFHHKFTHLFAVPAGIKAMLKIHSETSQHERDFELVVGGGALSAVLARKAMRGLTQNILIRYGATECPIVARTPVGGEEDLYWYRPVVDRTIEVVDRAGRLCANGEEGELRVALLETDADAYLDDEISSTQFFRDGYFYPGDMAVLREDGRVRILGRSSDVINMGGFKQAVAPLEQELAQQLGVDTVCLFTGISQTGGDELVVAIESETSPSHARLLGAIARFKSFEQARFEILAEFPRMRVGMQKIDRLELKRQVLRERPGQSVVARPAKST